jgi:hypothetical protein
MCNYYFWSCLMCHKIKIDIINLETGREWTGRDVIFAAPKLNSIFSFYRWECWYNFFIILKLDAIVELGSNI